MSEWKLSCKDCACHDCSQRENCAMNGCDGGGCEPDNLELFKPECDDYEAGWD
jgi:hypothetical protein